MSGYSIKYNAQLHIQTIQGHTNLWLIYDIDERLKVDFRVIC